MDISPIAKLKLQRIPAGKRIIVQGHTSPCPNRNYSGFMKCTAVLNAVIYSPYVFSNG